MTMKADGNEYRCEMAALAEDTMWKRKPELDKRIKRGDDFAGDAWVNDAGDVRYTVVSHK